MNKPNSNNSRNQRQGGGRRQQPKRGNGQRNNDQRQNGGQRGQSRRDRQPRQDIPRRPINKPGPASGVLELTPRGDGQLRDPERNFAKRPADVHIPANLVQKYYLRGGELIVGEVVSTGQGSQTELKIETIEGIAVDQWEPPAPLEEMTAIDPQERVRFSVPDGTISMRVLELFTPIGMGQRALIVAPPRTGKTMLLQQMAHGISTNHPDVYMIVLLVDERPEEVTEMRRNVNGEVYASSNDHDVESHVRLARLVLERARRMVEQGRHIIILLDSITRLARAFNNYVGSSGRTMTGGLDIRALQEPKQIFGAARCVENGGSLTIIGTALVETGSRADDFIFQEFKGTGNMELKLDRELADLRIWPAVDLRQSGTRKEEKLLSEDTLNKANLLRRHLFDLPPTKQIEELVQRMERHPDLESFLDHLRV